MKHLKIFVTGGAGYIGSHFIKSCHEFFKDQVTLLTFDDLSIGKAENVLYGDLLVGSLEDTTLLYKVLADFQPDIVLHFAASIRVEEAEENPWKYYQNNTSNTLNLLNILVKLNIPYFICSSTAAVYGSNCVQPQETSPLSPINVYGETKAMIDRILLCSQDVLRMRFLIFRYFNVVGVDPSGRLGQTIQNASHLMARAMEVIFGLREYLPIYGNKYPTADGTCIRDYIHVADLVQAHLQGIEYLLNGGKSDVFNLGYSTGFSVLDIVHVIRQVTGHALPIQIESARPGDIPILMADSTHAQEVLHWQPQYNTLSMIIEHMYRYQKKVFQDPQKNP